MLDIMSYRPVQDRVKPEDLRLIGQQPEKLVTPKISNFSDRAIKAINLPLIFGRFDNEYAPDVAIALIEKNAFLKPLTNQEIDTDWFSNALNCYRQLAIDRELMRDRDRLVAALIAHPRTAQGIEVQSIVLASEFRGLGIGSEFYRNFQEMVEKMGYSHLYGDHSASQHQSFFINDGAYPTDLLNPLVFDRNSGFYLNVPRSSKHTIKFLDPQLAEYCLNKLEKTA